MRIEDEKPKTPDNKELPDNVRRVMEIQQGRTITPPKTGDDLAAEAANAQAAPVENRVMQPAGYTGPIPPQFGQVQPISMSKAPASSQVDNVQSATMSNPITPTPPAPPPLHQQTAVPKEVAPKVAESKTREPKPAHLNEQWQRVDFPSNLVPYPDVNEIYLRPLTVPILERLYDAIEARNHAAYIDALDKCVSIDIRSLTVPDWIFAQYWIRIASYTRSPHTIKWTSKYGNEHTTSVKMTDLEIVYLKMTREEYAEWRSKGISFPTLRESEYMILADDEVGTENDWIQQNAQYLLLPDDFNGPDRMKEKIRILRERGENDVNFLTDIQDFAALTEHGVIESLKLRDSNFKMKEAMDFLLHSANQLRTLARTAIDTEEMNIDSTAGAIALAEQAEQYEKEAELIKAALEAGEQYIPEEEVVVLRSIQPTDMFPNTYRPKTDQP